MIQWFGLLLFFIVDPLMVVPSLAEDQIVQNEEVSKQELETPSSQQKVTPEKQEETETEKPPQEEDTDQISAIQDYIKPMLYKRDQYRDPFEKPATPFKMGQIYGPFLEAQNHNLDSFKLKGLIWKTRKSKAIFQGPDNKEYRLTIKDYIGENFGYIAAIREKEVVIIQTMEKNNIRYSTTKVVFLKDQ